MGKTLGLDDGGTARVSWDVAKELYENGEANVTDIANLVGVSRPAVYKHMKKYGWQQDEKLIALKAKRMADERAVRSQQLQTQSQEEATQAWDSATDDERSNAVALIGSSVLTEHRTMSQELRELAGRMINELREQCGNSEEMTELVEEFAAFKAARDGNPFAGQALLRALEALRLPGRVRTLGALTGTLERIVSIERTAWRLDDHDEEKPTYETLLERILAKRRAA